jgi:hypothetical protein
MDRRLYVLAVAVLAGSWLVLVLTSPGIPMGWDEGEYLLRAQRILEWIRFVPPDFSQNGIQTHWLFINYSEGHPAGFAIPIALGQWLASRFVGPLTAARLGPITVFSAACAAVAVRLKRDYGTTAAIVAPIALLTFPRMFSEAHFATQDGQLTAWWLLLWVVQSSEAAAAGSGIAVGVVLGLTTATKFTGWLAWAPTIASHAAARTLAALRRVLVIVPVALLTFYAVNPPLWRDPINGLLDHFHRNLDRAHTFDIPILFFGQIYSMQRPLPWYNTVAWLVIVTPLPTLVLGLIGLWHCLVRRTTSSVGLILHWITLMVVRALPGAPPHDGIRLFLPAFGLWCVFSGIGAQRAWNAMNTVPAAAWRIALRFAVVAALLASAVNLVRYYPQTLSHYNLLAGGVRGAASRGMEPAYWWDGLDNDVLRWLNEHTEPGKMVAFSPVSNMTQLHEWRRLRPKDVDPRKATFKWYVLQNRPGMFADVDRALMRRETPVFLKYAGRRRAGEKVPTDLDVPLILIFSYEQYQRAQR